VFEIGESLGLNKASGALVAEVTAGSPAEKGKIQKGDVILSFNDQMVNEMRNLPRIVASTKIGQKVPIVVWQLYGGDYASHLPSDH
jgi:serine protease Do